MTINSLKRKSLKRLPLSVITTALLCSSLLISACSNNDTDETANVNNANVNNADETAAVSETTTTDNDASAQAAAVETSDTAEDGDEDERDEIAITSDNINPVTSDAEQQSIVTNPTEAGTPEDTVKKALNTLYYGDAGQAAQYYQVDIDNFEQELVNTQSTFQQTVESVTITDTKYNGDQTRATINGELMLIGQSEPAPLTYELQKIKGQWKILG
ncbi:hypothetical protein [Psychrobacter jeotgali]|uniref:hypothetical protein n=1 Tax=Psychrobacter jeotgali TaxID=179010 RepID=UPI001919283E|nr:hypothetical protein [Psychrobacter jeotgali]